MPKQKNIIQFSLNEEQLKKLEHLANEQESLGLCAKRLLLEIFESAIQKIATQQAEDLESRLNSLERQFDERLKLDGVKEGSSIAPDYSNQLSELEKRLTNLERMNSIGMSYEDISDLEERINNLERFVKSTLPQIVEKIPNNSKPKKPKGFG